VSALLTVKAIFAELGRLKSMRSLGLKSAVTVVEPGIVGVHEHVAIPLVVGFDPQDVIDVEPILKLKVPAVDAVPVSNTGVP
jgi:hypothetical protein